MSTKALEGSVSKSQTYQGIVGLDVAGILANPDSSSTAVEFETANTNGAGFTFLLTPPSVVDSVVQLIAAL